MLHRSRGPCDRRAAALLLAVACAAPAAAVETETLRVEHRLRGSVELVDLAGSGTREGLQYVRWVTRPVDGGEQYVDVYAFDCARGRYAHVVAERYRDRLRVERIAVPHHRWSDDLRPLPPRYPAQAVHRARTVACAAQPRRP